MAALLIAALVIQLHRQRYTPWIYWLTVVLVAIFVIWHRVEHTLSIHDIVSRRRELFYWTAILCTFALGTAAVDLATEALSLGYVWGAVAFGTLIAISYGAWRHFVTRRPGRPHLRLGKRSRKQCRRIPDSCPTTQAGARCDPQRPGAGMDGLKRHLKASLQFRLSFTLSVVIIVVAVIAGTFSFFSALDEAHELQDDVLHQIAGLVDQQHLSPLPQINDTHLVDGDNDSHVLIQRLTNTRPDGSGRDANSTLVLPDRLSDGLHTLKSNGGMYRVLIRTSTTGERIAIAQETAFRDEIARNSALRTLMPFLILVPVLLLMVTNLVRKMFQPITALSREIDRRSDEDLRAVPDHHLPTEVRPFVIAINRLLARVAQAQENQRRFVVDAAHELRSPMTALSLQAEHLDDSDLPASTRERLAVLRQGIRRNRNLLDQLLSLAKAQSPADTQTSPVSILDLYRRTLEVLMPLAESRQVDIGVTQAQDIRINVNELDLTTLVRNLADNAIRYTPAGGHVDLSARATAQTIELCISDTGAGIPAEERERVFDPFYRVPGNEQIGSGLGLAIVKTIVTRLGASIHLDYSNAEARAGLKVTVRIPLKRRV